MSAPTESPIVPGPDLAPVLVALLRREGVALLRQRGRLNGLLRDYAPTAIRDIRLLLTAYDAGAPARMEAASDPMAAGMLSAEAERLVDEFGCARPLARSAVETWGRAFAGLKAPAGSAAAAALRPVAVAPTRSVAAGTAEEQPGFVGRWGGVAVGVLLVLVAVARWLGWM